MESRLTSFLKVSVSIVVISLSLDASENLLPDGSGEAEPQSFRARCSLPQLLLGFPSELGDHLRGHSFDLRANENHASVLREWIAKAQFESES